MNVGIEIQNASVTYETGDNAVRALSEITLSIDPAEFVCVIGESGCGKSTLLKTLLGLQKLTEGAIFIDNELVSGPDSSRGVVFQSPNLLPWLSVRSNLELGFRIREEKIPSDEIERVLKMVKLDAFASSKPKKLSGGMAQRASIARALVNKPKVLFMDEPFSALDAITRLRMQKELQRIWSSDKITTIFVTHDIDEAIMLGTKIVLMTPRPGKIGRIFDMPLGFPRVRTSAEFIQLKMEISEKMTDVTRVSED